MVKKEKMEILHKKLFSILTACGIAFLDADRLRTQWRHVTCKRCLQCQPKKEAAK